MASEIIAYVAVSLDGYIAAEDGTVSFLDDFGSEEYDFHGFFDRIDALVMGATTYVQVLGFGWPYGDLPCLVLTNRRLEEAEGATVTFSDADTGAAIRTLAGDVDGGVWIVGGGRVISDALEAGVVDELELYVMPVALGSGIPLFAEPFDGGLDLIEAHGFTNGVVRLRYRPVRPGGATP